MKENRQVLRTKKLIEHNFIKLLQTKNINQITVKAICENSNLNRGTFYHHYLDIYDLMNNIENNLIKELELYLYQYSFEQLNKDTLPLFTNILEFIDKNSTLVNILLRRNEESLFVEKLINLFKTTENWLAFASPLNLENYQYFIEYTIYGCLGIIKKWLQDEKARSPNEIAKLLEGIVINGANDLK